MTDLAQLMEAPLTAVAVVCRVTLTAVLGWAGVAKLLDPRGTRQAWLDLGLPARLAALAAALLPLAEGAVALSLWVAPLARAGALLGLWLLVGFTVAVIAALARGRAPACGCFGQWSGAALGWGTVARNAALIGIAALLASQGDTLGEERERVQALWAASPFFASLSLLALALAGATGLFAARQREENRALRKELLALGKGPAALERASDLPDVPGEAGLQVGDPAPPWSLERLEGGALSLDALRAGQKPVLLVFVSPGCDLCHQLLPDLRRWQDELSDRLTTAVVSQGSAEANRPLAEVGLHSVVLQQDRELLRAYGVKWLPSALIVKPNGTLGTPAIHRLDPIRRLVARAAALPPLTALLP